MTCRPKAVQAALGLWACALALGCGPPDGFTARLREVDDEIGLDGILAELNCGGHIPQQRVLNALRLLCEEVKPRFHRHPARAPQ